MEREMKMKYKSTRNILYSCVFLCAVTPFTFGVVEAATITSENSTLTTYDANTGDLKFEWDQNSPYDITGNEVTLNIDSIVTSGPSVIGTLYEFVIPNFYDPLPMKKIEITMEGANGGASGFDLPGVLDIIGADSDYINGGPALPVYGSFVSGAISPTLVTEYWEMFPNPDFEIVKLYVPIEFELQSITIATQSTLVPIPASVWLFGTGILGLVGVTRRKVRF
jgi:hypothetical protein